MSTSENQQSFHSLLLFILVVEGAVVVAIMVFAQ